MSIQTTYLILKDIEDYFAPLSGFSINKCSYRIYYNNKEAFLKRLEILKNRLRALGFKIYRISKEQKTITGMFSKRVYFKKIE